MGSNRKKEVNEMNTREKIDWVCDLYEVVDSMSDLESIMENSGFHKAQVWVFKYIHSEAKKRAESPEQRMELFKNELIEVADKVCDAFAIDSPKRFQ